MVLTAKFRAVSVQSIGEISEPLLAGMRIPLEIRPRILYINNIITKVQKHELHEWTEFPSAMIL